MLTSSAVNEVLSKTNFTLREIVIALENNLERFCRIKGNIAEDNIFWQTNAAMDFFETRSVLEMLNQVHNNLALNNKPSYSLLFKNIIWWQITDAMEVIVNLLADSGFTEDIMRYLVRNVNAPNAWPLPSHKINKIVILGNYFWRFITYNNSEWQLIRESMVQSIPGYVRSDYSGITAIIQYYYNKMLNEKGQENNIQPKENNIVILNKESKNQSQEIDLSLTESVWQVYNGLNGEEIDKTSRGAVLRELSKIEGWSIGAPVIFDILKEVLVNK